MAAACVAAAAAGCGSQARPYTFPPHLLRLTPTAPPRLAGRHRHRRPPTGPPIGTAQSTTFRGARLTITVERLIDPLPGSGVALLAGTRAVGVIVELVNAGPALYDSSATGDFSLVAARGPVTPEFVPRGICQTPVEDFDRYMTAGAVRSGCVAFALDSRARVLAVRFSPHDQRRGRLTWVPPKGAERGSSATGAGT